MQRHHFTVDVEEYFQVSAFEPLIPRSSWTSIERRVGIGMRRIIDLLARHDAKATFFVLGWIAVREPALVRELAAAGHEIASHGWGHRRVTRLTRGEFRQSVRRSKHALEDLTGKKVTGFRAPSFSIVPGLDWALDVLIEEGYEYDSSLVPFPRRGYGYGGAPVDPWTVRRPAGTLIEIPPTVLRLLGRPFSAAGGAYFRYLPYALIRRALEASARRGMPGTFFIHPWELDPEQPRVPGPMHTRMRHYGGLRRTGGRVERLLSDFEFRPVAETVAGLRSAGVEPQHA